MPRLYRVTLRLDSRPSYSIQLENFSIRVGLTITRLDNTSRDTMQPAAATAQPERPADLAPPEPEPKPDKSNKSLGLKVLTNRIVIISGFSLFILGAIFSNISTYSSGPDSYDFEDPEEDGYAKAVSDWSRTSSTLTGLGVTLILMGAVLVAYGLLQYSVEDNGLPQWTRLALMIMTVSFIIRLFTSPDGEIFSLGALIDFGF